MYNHDTLYLGLLIINLAIFFRPPNHQIKLFSLYSIYKFTHTHIDGMVGNDTVRYKYNYTPIGEKVFPV